MKNEIVQIPTLHCYSNEKCSSAGLRESEQKFNGIPEGGIQEGEDPNPPTAVLVMGVGKA